MNPGCENFVKLLPYVRRYRKLREERKSFESNIDKMILDVKWLQLLHVGVLTWEVLWTSVRGLLRYDKTYKHGYTFQINERLSGYDSGIVGDLSETSQGRKQSQWKKHTTPLSPVKSECTSPQSRQSRQGKQSDAGQNKGT